MTSNTRAFLNSTLLMASLTVLVGFDPPVEVSSQAILDDCDCGDDAEFGVYAAPMAETPEADHLRDITKKVATQFTWHPFNIATVKAARDAGKVLWIHVVHDGCGPCEKLKPIFRDPAFVTRVNEQLVAVQVDRFKGAGPAVVDAFSAGGNDPVDLFVFPDGRYLRYIGAPKDLAAYLNRLASFPTFEAEAKWPGYPVHKGYGQWKLDGETIDVNHMLTHSKHRDKFNEEWLRQLSRNELLTLHDHDHEPGDKVLWEYVPPPVD